MLRDADLRRAVDEVEEVTSKIANIKHDLEQFELFIRVNEPTRKALMDSKNDTQRKIIQETAYISPVNENWWVEKKLELRRAEASLSIAQINYDAQCRLFDVANRVL